MVIANARTNIKNMIGHTQTRDRVRGTTIGFEIQTVPYVHAHTHALKNPNIISARIFAGKFV